MNSLSGKRLGLLFILTVEGEEDEYAALSGTVEPADEGEWQIRSDSGQVVPLPIDAVDRLKQITDSELSELFGTAEYFLPLLVGELPEGHDKEALTDLGLKWPDTELETG